MRCLTLHQNRSLACTKIEAMTMVKRKTSAAGIEHDLRRILMAHIGVRTGTWRLQINNKIKIYVYLLLI